ncbi:MAG: ribonuclease III [Gemmiger sp.]|uniref:ribonuclease III n=1 Tax=Gemmiger sp. TaxID=2049027 RepID=UPI002E760951|nr:ribonuclease III [Gemmiger sp.]MEE0801249.1 ribonuclease III [Gemmiger sp.]
MTGRNPAELEDKLHYHFKDRELLITALTHSSYANEAKTPTKYNERLEFLGDSVLSVVVANYLFHHSSRPEGELSRMRASLVSEEALFLFAQEIDLGAYLRLGHGEELGGGRERPSVVSDAFEATIAALFLDGGIEAARNFILPFITEGKTAEEDYKTALQELIQQHPEQSLRYAVTGESGPAHQKCFSVTVSLDGKPLAQGSGRSKKAAEQQAAKAALQKLGQA